MTIKDIIFFFIPGFISTEVSRFFRPVHYQKQGEEKITSIVIFSLVNYFLCLLGVGRLPGLSSFESVRAFFTLEKPISFDIFLWTIAISVFTGYLWGIGVPIIIEKFCKKIGEDEEKHKRIYYLPDKPALNKEIFNNKEKFCTIKLKNEEQIQGQISKIAERCLST